MSFAAGRALCPLEEGTPRAAAVRDAMAQQSALRTLRPSVLLVVLRYLDLVGVSIFPDKAHLVLPVDAYAVLPSPVSRELFEPVARRYPEVLQSLREIEPHGPVVAACVFIHFSRCKLGGRRKDANLLCI